MVRSVLPVCVAAITFALVGCARQIKVVYSPSMAPAAVRIKSAKTIKVESFADKRVTEAVIVQFGSNLPSLGPVVENDVAKVIKDAIKDELGNEGYEIVEEGGDLVISGHLLDLLVTVQEGLFTVEYRGAAQISITVSDAGENRIIWANTVTGRSKPLKGLLVDWEQAINLALAQLIQNLVNSPSLHAALR